MSKETESKMELTQESNAEKLLDHVGQVPIQKPSRKDPLSKNGVIYFVVCLCIALVLFAVVAPKLENIDTYRGLTETLDEKREQVIGLSATLAGLSVVVAAVPGDSTTPIADNIANLSSYLVIVLGALMLEKFLLPIMALISWRILVPIGVILLGTFVMLRKNALLEWGVRLVVIGIMVFGIIPVGIKVGDVIDNSFNVQNSIDQIKLGFKEIDSEAKSDNGEEDGSEDDDKNFVEKVIDAGGDFFGGIVDAGSRIFNKAKVIIGEALEVIAAYIVTTCVIPIGVIFIIYAVAKGLLSMFMRKFPIELPQKTKRKTGIQEQQ